MTKQAHIPNLTELTENKVAVKAWAPPVTKRRLQEMADQAGQPLSKFTASILTTTAFPELARGPLVCKSVDELTADECEHQPTFGSVQEFEGWLVSEGVVSSAEDARVVTQMARHYLAPAPRGAS